MTPTTALLIYIGVAAVVFLLIWLDRQWMMAHAQGFASLSGGTAVAITLGWPFMLAILPVVLVGMGLNYLWNNPVLFKKKQTKIKKCNRGRR